ncbi:MAG: uridine phosphorylase [Microthrixaceae bacterium]
MTGTFHLGLTSDDLQGAELAIVPGDPGRVQRIASALEGARPLAAQREFTSWLGMAGSRPVVVCSSGIGGPSLSIAVEELARLGVRTFIRVGTTGGIGPDVHTGDLVVPTAAVRLEGASHDFAPAAYPAVADLECTIALRDAAEATGATVHVGVCASTDTFYPGQERYDTYSGRVPTRLRGSLEEWRGLGVLSFEMEAATLFTMCATQGLRSGAVLGVLANRGVAETPEQEHIEAIEDIAIGAAVGAAAALCRTPSQP